MTDFVSEEISNRENLFPRRKKFSLYASLLHKAFSSMKAGSLRMEFPDGRVETYGTGIPSLRATLRVTRPDFFKKCVLYGDIGLGESYVDGDWETDDLTQLLSWFILNKSDCPTLSQDRRKSLGFNLLHFANQLRHRFRSNTFRGSRKNIEEHYDLSNAFFQLFLDSGMTYSSAYFESENQSLETAQEAKYDRLCRKLKLRPADHVLEIGCGWGGFSLHAARRYGCRVTGLTISKEQFRYATERVRKEGLEDRIRIEFRDYRNVAGAFDKIASIEMIEAVGDRFLETYFFQCRRLLKKGGLLGLQMITYPDEGYGTYRKKADWIQKHIFPGSILPSLSRVEEALRRTGSLKLSDLTEMGPSYARTLETWHRAFHQKLPEVKRLGYNDAFIRKWNYYLCICRAAFQMGHIHVVQAIYSDGTL
ncbi:MAG: cyclopropane-fatty-acyl-phospholipid synthase family protein [bacterium]